MYVLECRSGRYYCGATNNIERRYAQHLAGTGAKYTRGDPPTRLLAAKSGLSKSEALKLEWAFKQLNRADKTVLIQDWVEQA